MKEIPTKYLISKGVSFKVQNEEDPIPTTHLECYEYDIEKGEDGWYLASCQELHAHTQGKTWKELKDNILEVHSLMLEDYDKQAYR